MSEKIIKSKNIVSIDFMKALCIIMVIINHASFTSGEETKYLFPFYIDPAVPIFLMMTGFTYSMSSNGKINSIWEWYDRKNFSKKLMRILPGYVVVIIFELIVFPIFNYDYTGKELLEIFLTGGKGPGSYYVIILFQLIVVFPIIFFLFKKNPGKTAFIVVFIHISYEIVKNIIDIPYEFYRLSILRFLLHILLGIFLYFYKDKIKGTYLPLIFLIVGVLYFIHSMYLGYEPVVFTSWGSTVMPAALYAFAILYFVMSREKWFFEHQVPLTPIREIGKASYHIFLAQMVYHAIWYDYIYGEMSRGLGILVSLAISIASGYIFYQIENVCRKKIALIKKNP